MPIIPFLNNKSYDIIREQDDNKGKRDFAIFIAVWQILALFLHVSASIVNFCKHESETSNI
jgi:hypothetical protein